MLNYDKIMMAALTKNYAVLADAVPELIATIRSLEVDNDKWHRLYLEEVEHSKGFRQDVLDATEEILKEFPGSKLDSSIAR